MSGSARATALWMSWGGTGSAAARALPDTRSKVRAVRDRCMVKLRWRAGTRRGLTLYDIIPRWQDGGKGQADSSFERFHGRSLIFYINYLSTPNSRGCWRARLYEIRLPSKRGNIPGPNPGNAFRAPYFCTGRFVPREALCLPLRSPIP